MIIEQYKKHLDHYLTKINGLLQNRESIDKHLSEMVRELGIKSLELENKEKSLKHKSNDFWNNFERVRIYGKLEKSALEYRNLYNLKNDKEIIRLRLFNISLKAVNKLRKESGEDNKDLKQNYWLRSNRLFLVRQKMNYSSYNVELAKLGKNILIKDSENKDSSLTVEDLIGKNVIVSCSIVTNDQLKLTLLKNHYLTEKLQNLLTLKEIYEPEIIYKKFNWLDRHIQNNNNLTREFYPIRSLYVHKIQLTDFNLDDDIV